MYSALQMKLSFPNAIIHKELHHEIAVGGPRLDVKWEVKVRLKCYNLSIILMW